MGSSFEGLNLVNKLSLNGETGHQGGTRSTLLHPDSSILKDGLGMTWLLGTLHTRDARPKMQEMAKTHSLSG